jgi:hypothetical protein
MQADRRLVVTARRQAACALGLLLLGAAVLVAFPPSRYAIYPSCPLRSLTGLACPLCGATRALAALLAGRCGEAIHRNILVIGLLPLALVVVARSAYQAVRWDRWEPLIPARAVGPLIIIAVVFGIARNLAPRLLGP